MNVSLGCPMNVCRLLQVKENGRHRALTTRSCRAPPPLLLLAIELVEHVIVALDTLLPSMVHMVRVA